MHPDNDQFVGHAPEPERPSVITTGAPYAAPVLQGPGAQFQIGGGITVSNEHFGLRDRRLGRLPARATRSALMLSRFADFPSPPPRTSFWRRRRPFPVRTFGNLQYGCCTIAKQAVAAMRMERIETRNTPEIADEEVIRVYRALSDRLYGGGDNGAYETDALDNWRRRELSFRDAKGRALTIDAYLRLNPFDHTELRAALYAAGAHGIAVCLNLPLAFQRILPPDEWDIPEGQPLTGLWMPGGWGGHSMWAHEYDEHGIWLDHTWNYAAQRLTWRAAAAYLDEAHLVIDSLNYWRRHKPALRRVLDLDGIRKAVNQVSSVKIEAAA